MVTTANTSNDETTRRITNPPGLSQKLEQLSLNPFQFLADIVHDVAGLQVIGQDVPCVGLDLELTGDRIRFVESQSVLDGEPSRAKRPEIIEENRDVNVCTPFTRTGVGLPCDES